MESRVHHHFSLQVGWLAIVEHYIKLAKVRLIVIQVVVFNIKNFVQNLDQRRTEDYLG